MPFTTKKMDEGRFVLSRFEGRLTILDLQECRSQIKGALRESRWKKAMFDLRGVEPAVSAHDLYDFVTAGQLPYTQIAVLIDDVHKENGTFIENLAANRGLSRKVFYCEESARKWLIDPRPEYPD